MSEAVVAERELHLVERPQSLKMVVGQQDAVAQLKALAESKNGIPHCLLFTGPSGCGKTTLARIIRKKLKCGDTDFFEVNAAENRGIEMVRGIQQRMGMAPISGDTRVWLVDEAHQLTAEAQGAFLKMLEEPQNHVYFILATTHPEKLREAIKTRCTEIKVRHLTQDEICSLVHRVAEEHGGALQDEVEVALAGVAEGSARKALVLLQQIMGLPTPEEQIAALEKVDAKKAAIEIARALMAGKPWKDVAAIVAKVDEEPESIRYMILSYFSKVALGGNGRAIEIMEEFQYNYFDTKKAGLIMSCHRACNRGK